MSTITDEILNRYIDGELDSSELAEVKNELENDAYNLSRLQALRAVDNSLRHLETENAPDNITEKIMKVISSQGKVVKSKINYFILAVISVFSLGFVGVFIAAFKAADSSASQTTFVSYQEKLKNGIVKNVSSIQSFFSDPGVILAVSVLSLILLIVAYFTFESHKNFTKKLNSIPH